MKLPTIGPPSWLTRSYRVQFLYKYGIRVTVAAPVVGQFRGAGHFLVDPTYRFKGQEAHAVILTDIDPVEHRKDHWERSLLSEMSRADRSAQNHLLSLKSIIQTLTSRSRFQPRS